MHVCDCVTVCMSILGRVGITSKQNRKYINKTTFLTAAHGCIQTIET